ncbi:MAG: putative permease of the drug/metabolite transporter superfamily [Thermodesulfobacteriota bacterium]|nr:putative permease of the drug/metabolite transporter superfamily [Thermodesulfobacteriota bacterium]
MPIAALFVILWSTGFIGAKLGLPYAEPFTFLMVRFLIVTALLMILALATRAPWPESFRQVFHLGATGILIHATFLSGVFSSIYKGVPAGVTALIVGLQPLLTAALAGPFLGERVTARQWAGFILGLVGVAFVVQNKLSLRADDLGGLMWSLVALLGMTAGTLYQKKHCSMMDLRTGAVIQYAAAAIILVLLAPVFETMTIEWSGEFVFALLWLSIVLSVGAITLLYVLIRRGKASAVASLFYLVPPCTALIAYFMFGETLELIAILGMALAVLGVAMVTWKN